MSSGNISQDSHDPHGSTSASPRGDKLPATRRSRILDYVASNGEASVTELAEHFGVSADTVRRDLERLDDAGVLTRTHGGAHRVQPAATLDSIAARRSSYQRAKRAMGRRASELILDDETLLLNGGTTTLEVARALGDRRRLTVVTCSPAIAQAIPPGSAHAIYLLGGEWHPEFEVIVGPVSLPGARSLHADTLVLGAAGVSALGVSIPNLEEAAMLQEMIHSAARVILVADSSKFGRDAVAMIASLADIDTLVTDAMPDSELLHAAEHGGMEIVLADHD